MKEIILKALQLKNFKGAEDVKIDFNGSTNIFAANGCFKSTLHTAWMWVLTGKDEFDRTDYELKNTFKKELNAQGHEVQVILSVNGEEVILKRIYWERWQKPKGQSQKVFKGHETEYFYNDVPCNATEYQKKIDAIIASQIIKLCTNPGYFNSLKWEDQRRGLLGIAGTISNDDVISKIATPENDFSTLILALNAGQDITELKKKLSAKKGLLKKKADEYGPRIDEAGRNKPDAQDWKALEKEKTEVEVELKKVDTLLTDSTEALKEIQKELNAKSNQLFKKRNELVDIKNNHKQAVKNTLTNSGSEITTLTSELNSINSNISRLEKEVVKKEESIGKYKVEIDRLDKLIAEHRQKWDSINAEKFTFDDSKTVCPTCSQSLPAADIEKTKSELQANFNKDVADRKRSEVAKSDQKKADKEAQQNSIEQAATDKINLENTIAEEKIKIAPLEEKIKQLKESSVEKTSVEVEELIAKAISEDETATTLAEEISALEDLIEEGNQSLEKDNPDKSKNIAKKEELNLKLKEVNDKLALKVTIENTEERIKQLEKEEQLNAQEIADIEKQEIEIEMFSRAKNDLIQERVNKMFHHVSFRLFKEQVNGELAETCVCEYKGVPYPTLNTASKMLAGLDVIRTFQQFYCVSIPVFCDNRESVTEIPETGSQVISLFVSPEDKKLRVEKA